MGFLAVAVLVVSVLFLSLSISRAGWRKWLSVELGPGVPNSLVSLRKGNERRREKEAVEDASLENRGGQEDNSGDYYDEQTTPRASPEDSKFQRLIPHLGVEESMDATDNPSVQLHTSLSKPNPAASHTISISVSNDPAKPIITTMPPPSPPMPPLEAKPAASSLMPPPSVRPSGLRPLPKINGSLMPPPSAASALRGPPPRQKQSQTTGGGGLAAATPMSTSTLPPSSRPSRKVQLEPGHSPMDWAQLTRHPPSATFLRGADVPANLIKVPPSQLRSHNGRKGSNAWGTWQGRVYNLTPYLKFHPGGVGELMRGAGKVGEAERLFNEIHPWVNWEAMLGDCLIGILVSEGEAVDSVKGAAGGGPGLEEMD